MRALLILMTVLFSIFSTAIMTYISMATPIGPWVAPMLVLLATIIFRFFLRSLNTSSNIALCVIGASVGGIVATACGFSFPTLYFLDKTLFDQWMHNPLVYITVVSGLVFAAGAFGMLIANFFEEKLLVQDALPFPIGQLVYKMIAAQKSMRKACELMAGFVGAVVICIAQQGIWGIPRLFNGCITITRELHTAIFTLPALCIRMDQAPMLWAIGFITGHIIAIPLAIGVIAKIFIVDPVNTLLFPAISSEDFLMAFCSGIVVASAAASFAALPSLIVQIWGYVKNATFFSSIHSRMPMRIVSLSGAIVLIFCCIFLWYFKFSIVEQLYLFVCCTISSYYIAMIAGKIGLALLGRFATFVMVPAYFIFGLSYLQVVIVATWVEIAGGVAADILFGRKTAQLAHVPRSTAQLFQWIGLFSSAITVGVVMWLLIHHLGLGSQELTVQRAQARALLLNFTNFNYYVLCIGAVFGYCIERWCKVSPMLVLGGLLMSLQYALMLIAGGLSTRLVKDREAWEPFWSGVFAGNSLWIIFRALMHI